MSDPTASDVAQQKMGLVQQMIEGYTGSDSPKMVPPAIPSRRGRLPLTVEKQPESISNGKGENTDKVNKRKNKFKPDPSANSGSSSSSSQLQQVPLDKPPLPPTAAGKKVVRTAVTQELTFETATEIRAVSTQKAGDNSGIQHNRKLLCRPLSPSGVSDDFILDSSFDEISSDEDVIANNEMGVGNESPVVTSAPKQVDQVESNSTAKNKRNRSTVISKNPISRSPSEKRNSMRALSKEFTSHSIERRQTLGGSPLSAGKMERTSRNSQTVKHSSTSSRDSDSSYLWVESGKDHVLDQISRVRTCTDPPPSITSCNDVPKTVTNLPSGKRYHIIQEVYSSEWSYVNGLEILVEVFKNPLKPILKERELDGVFANIEDLLRFNLGLLAELYERLSDWTEETTIGDIFINKFNQQRKTMYAVYCNNYDNAEQLIYKLAKRKKEFESAINNCLNNPRVLKGLRIDSFLITPIQRILKYPLLLGDLIRNTQPDHDDYTCLEGARNILTELAEYMNAQRLEVETVQKVQALKKKVFGIVEISKNRVIIKEGNLCLQSIRKPYKCLLFNDLLVFALNRDTRQIVELQLPLEAVWVGDLKNLDPQGFKEDAIEVYTPDRPYTIYTGSQNDKKLWLSAIKEAIYNLLVKQAKCIENSSKSIVCRKATFVYPNSSVYSGEYCDGRRHGYGELYWPDKTLYRGNWVDDDRCGEGDLTYNTGEVYHGDWQDDKQNGMGTVRYTNEDEYRGVWYDGVKHGLGHITFKNGDKFEGRFVNGQISGKGVLTCANGLMFDGNWENSQRSGKGKLRMVSGNLYEGDFVKNIIHGEGIMTYSNGDKYKGTWKCGMRSGIGEHRGASGDVYNGHWDRDMKNGGGKYVYCNGDEYNGSWRNNMQHGKGKIIFAIGDAYAGNFDHGVMSGEGEMRYKVGGKYFGHWENGKFSGDGIREYPDKSTYNGKWRHGLRTGRGEFIDANATCYHGEWECDKPHGNGTLKTPHDDYTYDGEWVYGMREGKGQEITSTGIYEGEWRGNLKHGVGTERSLVGTTYEGRWVQNHKDKRGLRKMVFGYQEEQVWIIGDLQCNDRTMTCVELAQLPRMDY